MSQTPPQQIQQKPQTIATAGKVIKAAFTNNDREVRNVEIIAAFAISEARADDTVAGALVFTLPESSRRLIAESSGKQPSEIPASITQPDVIASFEKGTACPEVEFVFPPLDLNVASVKLQAKRFSLHLIETPQELPRLFCIWTRQINAHYENRQGVVRRINRLLKGDEE